VRVHRVTCSLAKLTNSSDAGNKNTELSINERVVGKKEGYPNLRTGGGSAEKNEEEGGYHVLFRWGGWKLIRRSIGRYGLGEDKNGKGMHISSQPKRGDGGGGRKERKSSLAATGVGERRKGEAKTPTVKAGERAPHTPFEKAKESS